MLREAEELYLKAVKKFLNSNNPGEIKALLNAYLYLGDLSIKQGRKKTAKKYFMKIMKFNFPYFSGRRILNIKEKAREKLEKLNNRK